MTTVDGDALCDAHIDGIRAALDGEPRSACPWSPSTHEGMEWCRGWAEQEWQRRVESGQADADTQRMKAEANASVADLPEYQPDPCAIVADDQPEWSARFVDAMGSLVNHVEKIAVSFSGLNQTFQQWQVKSIDPQAWIPASVWEQQANPAIGVTIDPKGLRAGLIALDEPFGINVAPPPLSRAERRHGSAATCPLHGATKGGLCRKCARGR